MKSKVLLVDDDSNELALYKGLLELEGFSVVLAKDAEEAFSLAMTSHPDLVLVDVVMPVVDGFALCRRFKQDLNTAAIPIILFSGSQKREEDLAEGLDLGADDFIPKPFTSRLLAAKIRTVLRRYQAPGQIENILRTQGLRLNLDARTVSVKNRPVRLTRKEFDLLTTLLRKRGHVLGVAYLLETVWGYDPAYYNDPHTLEAHVCSLRKKLGSQLGKRIITLPRLGYRLD